MTLERDAPRLTIRSASSSPCGLLSRTAELVREVEAEARRCRCRLRDANLRMLVAANEDHATRILAAVYEAWPDPAREYPAAVPGPVSRPINEHELLKHPFDQSVLVLTLHHRGIDAASYWTSPRLSFTAT